MTSPIWAGIERDLLRLKWLDEPTLELAYRRAGQLVAVSVVDVCEDALSSVYCYYDPAFAASGIEIAPLMMPLSRRVYAFPELALKTFYGLPGLLAYLTIFAELAGGLALLLGVATRAVALALSRGLSGIGCAMLPHTTAPAKRGHLKGNRRAEIVDEYRDLYSWAHRYGGAYAQMRSTATVVS